MALNIHCTVYIYRGSLLFFFTGTDVLEGDPLGNLSITPQVCFVFSIILYIQMIRSPFNNTCVIILLYSLAHACHGQTFIGSIECTIRAINIFLVYLVNCSGLVSQYLSYKSSSEKLLKYQLIISCVIMSLILITNLFYKALISQGEF